MIVEFYVIILMFYNLHLEYYGVYFMDIIHVFSFSFSLFSYFDVFLILISPFTLFTFILVDVLSVFRWLFYRYHSRMIVINGICIYLIWWVRFVYVIDLTSFCGSKMIYDRYLLGEILIPVCIRLWFPTFFHKVRSLVVLFGPYRYEYRRFYLKFSFWWCFLVLTEISLNFTS